MKKSMFKRGIASATGILLAASQLGVVAMNATAADVTVDASYLTDVPVFVNPDGVLEYTDGSWYDLLAAAYTAAEALDQQVSLDAAKNAAEKLFGAYLDAEIVDAIVNSVSDATLTGVAGQYVIAANVAECGPAVGAAIAEKIAGVKGAAVDMSVYGTITVAVDMTTENTVAAVVAFTAEDGQVYTAENIDTYVLGKLSTALGTVGAADQIAPTVEKINTTKDAISNISVSATDFESAYAAYVAVLPESLAAKAPATLAEAIANEKVNKAFDEVVAAVNGAQDIASIDLTVADLAGIAAQAYDIVVAGEGMAASAHFSIADDQNAELLAAFQEYYTTADKLVELQEYFVEDYELAEGYIYNVVDVQSHKELTVSGAVGAISGASYEIVRVIDSVTLEVVDIPEVEYTYDLIVAENLNDNWYYWSEEDVAFDISSVAGSLVVYADGVQVDNIVLPNEYFFADAATPADLEYTGYGVYTVGVNLSAEGYDAIVALLEDKGCDITNLDDAIIPNLNVASFDVIVMERGDASLDEAHDSIDGIVSLQLYNRVTIQKMTISETQALFGMNDQDFAAMCFASDVNADQTVNTFDAIDMLKYYNRNTIQGEDVTWDEIVGVEVTHDVAQHADPLVIFNQQ